MIVKSAVAKFEKVSREQYAKDFTFMREMGVSGMEEDIINDCYSKLTLPVRKTKLSAGYDFSFPFSLVIPPHTEMLIFTGIKCMLKEGYVLKLYPRSSLGFKYRMQLNNTVGIIDADYYNNESNEGNIGVKVFNPSDRPIILEKGQAICQGIIECYFLAEEEEVTRERTGGIGSTDKEV